jgi:hypothetical protein
MTSDYRITPGLVHEIVDALERHGYYRSQTHLRDALAYDGMAGRLAWVAPATRADEASQPEPDPRPQPAADREAGQLSPASEDGSVGRG